jgi:GT2 family glycosyltransferase/glycosyltransferase involved in cell wall biosynthesis
MVDYREVASCFWGVTATEGMAELDRIAPGSLPTIFRDPARQGAISAWWGHVPFAHWLMRVARPRLVVELGTHNGVSYAAFCSSVEAERLASRCCAIDTWEGDHQAGRYDGRVFEEFRTWHDANYGKFSTLMRCTFDEAAPQFEDGSIDLLHMDGLHTYEAVRHDFETWLPKLSLSGIVMIHDTEERNGDFGVWRLWEELRDRYPSFNFRHSHGLGLLAIGEDVSSGVLNLCSAEGTQRAEQIEALFGALGRKWSVNGELAYQHQQAAELRDATARQRAEFAATLAEIQARCDQMQLEASQAALAADKAREESRLARMGWEAAKSELATARSVIAAASAAEQRHHAQMRELRSLQEATVHDLLRQADRMKGAMKGPVVSLLSTHAATLAAQLPGLSERRRQKLQNSSRKRSPKIFAENVIATLRNLQAESVARARHAGEKHEFLANDLDGKPIANATTGRDIDIVVCVHNALDDVKVCLSSIIANTRPPYRLILVDDGSRDDTKQYLEAFAAAQGAIIIRSDQAGGYTRAANRGLRESRAPWTVLLNSDTIVPFGWTDELLKIGESDDMIGIVGPASNTASWQSAPRLFNEDGDWANNPLLPNVDVEDMQRLVSSVAPPQGIDLPFLNGFAFMIRRSLIDDIGIFDEETFGAGYGEENDFCIRARRSGWKLIFVPSVYVFHAQSKSYSTEARLKLAAAADAKLGAKHDPHQHIWPQVQYCKDSLATLSFRARLAVMLEDTVKPKCPFEGKRLAVFCPVASSGGGGNILVQESLLMAQLGAQVWLINMEANRILFEKSYPESVPTLYFENGGEIKAFLQKNELKFDAVIASAFFTTDWLPDGFDGKVPKIGYYIQDDEPAFFKENWPSYRAAVNSYALLHRACGFTKTNWNADAIKNRGFPRPFVVGCSVDLSRFRPKGRDLDPNRPMRLAAMLRFESSVVDRRAPDRTVRVVNRLAAAYGASVELIVFGSDPGHASKSALAKGVIDLGVLRPDEVAILMRNVDVFLDFSAWQAMGLSAMEAMASGCTVVMPRNGGAVDFCVDGHNALIVDSEDEDACFAAASRLIDDPALLAELRKNATQDICRFSQERSARRILELLFGPPT